MTRFNGSIFLLVTAAAVVTGTAVFANSSETDRLEDHVVELTRPEMKGRSVGSEGHDLARDYIVEQFESVGLEPAGTDGWFTATTIVWDVRTARSTELRAGDTLLARGVDYRPLGFSDDAVVESTAVFVGYGVSAPAAGWDDYAGVDVEGKVVIALTDAPDGIDTSTATDDAKAATALAKGAAGFLLVNAPRTHGDLPEQRPDELGRMRPSPVLSGLSAGRLTRRTAEKLFGDLGLELTALQQEVDRGGPASRPIALDVKMTLAVERDEANAQNVVGEIPGTGPPVVLGAHFDHLGEGNAGSLWDGEPMTHPGADDNASGVAVIIEVARRLRRDGLTRPVIIAATTGEEIGLRGARRLSRTLAAKGSLYVNLDMVGRLRDPGLNVLGLERLASLREAVTSAAKTADVTVIERDLYESSSDHIAFSESGFDALSVTTGRHSDYHQPSDTLERLNLEGMQRVTVFVTELIGAVAR